MIKFLLLIYITIGLISCSNQQSQPSSYPKPAVEKKQQQIGSLTGNSQKHGFTIFGRGENSKVLQANEYLWKAALEVLNFVPLAHSDSAGGVLITEWHSEPKLNNEKFKFNIIISSGKLDANTLKVRVFKKKKINNQWLNIETNPIIANQLTEQILNKAKQLKVGHKI